MVNGIKLGKYINKIKKTEPPISVAGRFNSENSCIKEEGFSIRPVGLIPEEQSDPFPVMIGAVTRSIPVLGNFLQIVWPDL